MKLYLQVCGAILIAVILVLSLKHNKEFGSILAISACCLTVLAALHYLRPVINFLHTLQTLPNLDVASFSHLLIFA